MRRRLRVLPERDSGGSAGEPQNFKNNSKRSRCFSTPMGRARKETCQTGWRYPIPIIEAVRTEARRQGIREGKLVEQILRRHLDGWDGITPKLVTGAGLVQPLTAQVGMNRSPGITLA